MAGVAIAAFHSAIVYRVEHETDTPPSSPAPLETGTCGSEWFRRCGLVQVSETSAPGGVCAQGVLSHPSSPPLGYALLITGANHVRISGDDRYGCCWGRLARWQCAAPAVPVRAGLPYPLVMRVSCSLECGSHAAAPAVHTIRRVVRRYPSWSRGCWMCSCRSSSRSGMHAIPARRRLCCKRFVPVHQRPRPAPDGNRHACTQPGSLHHEKPAPRGALAARPNAA